MDRPSKHVARTALGALGVVLCFVCLAASVLCVLLSTIDRTTAAGASAGLAIAGGLCLVAATIAESGASRT
jgi:hypothetical protein